MKPDLHAPVIVCVFIAAMAALGQWVRFPYLLFPELAALAYGVLTNPYGEWARARWHLFATPVIAALIGTILSRYFGFGFIQICLSLSATIFCLSWFRSPIIPAISAGLLPVVLGIRAFSYPLSVGIAILMLIVLSKISNSSTKTETYQSKAWQAYPRHGLYRYAAFIVSLAAISCLPGWRLILFPPLAVIAFDRLVLGTDHLWHGQVPVLFVIGTLNTGIAALLVSGWGATPLTVGASVAAGIMLLRAFRSSVAPVLAIGLLPFVTHRGDVQIVAAIGLGLAALSAAAILARRFEPPQQNAVPVRMTK
ncbi:MAG TPA: hypothetical protein VMV54_03460 [Acidocella sp.]|nr:hypothetical protein [Acidocella sp.]